MGLKKGSKKKRRENKAPLHSRGARRKQALQIVSTDSTYRLREGRFGTVWEGKCLFCNRKLSVGLSGETRATVEHILARNHGGTNDPHNTALACGSCNGEKGRNHDNQKQPDMDYVNRLLAKRQERWRDPDD
jgi:hypothetical protein